MSKFKIINLFSEMRENAVIMLLYDILLEKLNIKGKV